MSTLTAFVDLLPAPSSVPAARHIAVELMRAWGVPQDTDDAALLVTELWPTSSTTPKERPASRSS